MKNYIALAALTVVLSACGGGGGSSTPTPSDPSTPVAPTVDAFTTSVSNIVASSSETSEPSTFDSLATTSPDNTEPTPII